MALFNFLLVVSYQYFIEFCRIENEQHEITIDKYPDIDLF